MSNTTKAAPLPPAPAGADTGTTVVRETKETRVRVDGFSKMRATERPASESPPSPRSRPRLSSPARLSSARASSLPSFLAFSQRSL